MQKILFFLGTSFLVASAALAHQGVKNPAVKARMDAMRVIGDNTKVLGTMAKGEREFDRNAANQAVSAISVSAGEISALFEAHEDDPKSEALPAIWSDFSDFSARAEALKTAADDISGTIGSLEDLRPALAAIGKTCKSCHKTYRK